MWFGHGMMRTGGRQQIEKVGGAVGKETDVGEIDREGNCVESVLVSCNRHTETVDGTDFISSLPITEFIKKLNPSPPPGVLQAAEKIHYRDFLTVCLVVNKSNLFPDNWIYIHDPDVKVGRIQ